jgi:hypothetical protein
MKNKRNFTCDEVLKYDFIDLIAYVLAPSVCPRTCTGLSTPIGALVGGSGGGDGGDGSGRRIGSVDGDMIARWCGVDDETRCFVMST